MTIDNNMANGTVSIHTGTVHFINSSYPDPLLQPYNIYSSCYIYHGIITYFGSLQQGTHTSISVHFFSKI